MKKASVSIICLALVLAMVFSAGNALSTDKQPATAIKLSKSNPNMTKVMQAVTLETYENVFNKYKVAYYFWYDTFAEGEIPPANVVKANANLEKARKLIDLGTKNADTISFNKADKLLKEADKLLNERKKSPDQFPYETSTPLLQQDASKVYKAKAADYLVLDRYGVLMNDVGPSIWGYADDGEYYLITTFYNYHARGKIIKPVVIEIMSTKDPNKRYVYLLNAETKVTRTKDSVEYNCADGEKSFRTLVKDDPVGGGTTVLSEGKFPAVPGKAPAISFSVTTTPTFSYWYNQNLGAAMMYPDIVLAGFEQPGPAWGTITIDGRKATFNKTAGAVTEVCMISGAPGKKYDEYRTNMTRYGNEWYIAIHSDQVDAMFISYGKFRDAGIYYKGRYIIPTEYRLVPGIANQTITLIAKTKEYGDLVMNFVIKLHDPVYTERVATLTGTFDGHTLSNGGAWFEHVFKGAPDGIAAVQEYPQIVDPM
jgi:hypothetical protein